MKSPAIEASGSDFNQAIGDLKGLRPFAGNPVISAPVRPADPVPAVADPPLPQESQTRSPAAQPPLEEPQPPAPKPGDGDPGNAFVAPEEPHPRSAPILIHLAAGMAIEVDGTLDLRRHSLNDAKERLKERIRDGLALRWRTLLVMLGPNEALKQGFLAFLTTPQAQFISRYAQAPIPMGGAQAWILYLSQASDPPHKPLRPNNPDLDNGGSA
ncbi:MAG: Smr/MutS family protein [Holophagaceae bacterium]|nr:Smr/MutS family protein [Holophagaceae bacterium]